MANLVRIPFSACAPGIESGLNVVARAVCGRGITSALSIRMIAFLVASARLLKHYFALRVLHYNTHDLIPHDLTTDLPAMFHPQPPQAGPCRYEDEAMTSSDVKRLTTSTVVPPSTPAP